MTLFKCSFKWSYRGFRRMFSLSNPSPSFVTHPIYIYFCNINKEGYKIQPYDYLIKKYTSISREKIYTPES